MTGCGGGTNSFSVFDNAAGGSDRPAGLAEWTVLVYMNADNDLEPFGVLNFNQMEKIGSTSRVNIIVQMDRSPGFDSTNGDWTDTRRFRIRRDTDAAQMTSPVLEDLGEVDMGDPAALSDFIRWGQSHFPAKHYCLVIWNHGSGWRARAGLAATVPRNISFDDTSETSIRTIDLPGALAAANPRIDLIAMDASLMQMAEVAYELRDSALYLVGSEESPPGEGYVYDRWLGRLAASPNMTPAALGKVIVDEFVDAYTGSFSVTQSVVDLARIGDVAAAVDGLAGALIPLAAGKSAALASARSTAQQYAFVDYKDLLDFAERAASVLGDASVSSALIALQQAMTQAIVAEGHTGSSVAQSHGLSIYIPPPGSYLTRYEELMFAKDTRWDEFLKAQTR